jgi:hypothetical protein
MLRSRAGGSLCTKSSGNTRRTEGGWGVSYKRKTPVVRSAEQLEFSSLHHTVAYFRMPSLGCLGYSQEVGSF